MSANRAEPSEISGPKATSLRVLRILDALRGAAPGAPGPRPVRQLLSLARWGATVAGGYRAAAARSPRRIAVIDEQRSVTFREVQRRAVRLANGLEKLGAAPGSRVAVLCRNHAWFVEAVVAAAELGADVVLVNTGLSVRATAEVLRAHEPAVIIADAEFADHVAAARLGVPFLVAWPDATGPGSGRPFGPAAHRMAATATVDDVIATSSGAKRRPPKRAGPDHRADLRHHRRAEGRAAAPTRRGCPPRPA